MNDFLEVIAAAALSNAVVATALGVAAWATSRWAKPTVAHALWLLVLVKLVTPPVFETRVPLPVAFSLGNGTSPEGLDSAADRPASDFTLPAASSNEQATDIAGQVATGAEFPGAQFTLGNDPFIDDPFIYEIVRNDATLSLAHSSGGEAPFARTEEPFPAVADEQRPAKIPDVAATAPAEVAAAIRPDADAPPALETPRNATEDFAPSATPNRIVAEAAQTSVPPSDVVEVAKTSSIGSIAPVLFCVWVAGSAAWFVLAIARIVRFRRALDRAIPATPPLQREVAALAGQIGLGRVPDVLIIPGQISPLVCTPLGRAVLVLPRDLLARFSAEQRAAVIAHELAHLRRRDHWTRWLELVAIGCYWWLPAVWFARRQLHVAEEACCDAWVVWLLPERSRDYARALLETIDFLTPAPDAPLLASGFGRASTLKRRFDMILRQRASHRLSWPARIGIAAAGLVILPWSLTALSADEQAKTPTATIQDSPPAGLPRADKPPSADKAPAAENPPSALPEPVGPPSAGNTDPSLTPNAPRRNNGAPPAIEPFAPPTASNAPTPLTQPPVTPSILLPPTAAPGAYVPPDAHHEPALSNANVLARLERLEATTAELLAIVKQLRDEQQGSRSSLRSLRGPIDETVPVTYFFRYGHGDRQLNIEVSGRQITASDAETGRTLWSTTMSWNVTSLQGAQGNLMAAGLDGGQALIDPSNGSVKATNRPMRADKYPAATDRPTPAPSDPSSGAPAVPPTPTYKSSVTPADRSKEIAKIELEMLDAERKLAQQRADLQHEVRQLENGRARLVRQLDNLPQAEANADQRTKLLTQIDEVEDQLAAMQHKVDTFEADLEFKVRELQVRRDQLLRTVGNPYEQPTDATHPNRAGSR